MHYGPERGTDKRSRIIGLVQTCDMVMKAAYILLQANFSGNKSSFSCKFPGNRKSSFFDFLLTMRLFLQNIIIKEIHEGYVFLDEGSLFFL